MTSLLRPIVLSVLLWAAVSSALPAEVNNATNGGCPDLDTKYPPTKISGYCYYVETKNNGKPFHEAQRLCTKLKHGGHFGQLAVTTIDAQFNNLYEYVHELAFHDQHAPALWMGAMQTNQAVAAQHAAGWYWVNHNNLPTSPVSRNAWKNGQRVLPGSPNDGDGCENCAVLLKNDGGMDDRRCTSGGIKGFICMVQK